ncbi:uncharacterized protein LOC127844917 [Dreissena polymorpha]|uniref:Band 7 domain-containing protein n=1 Tax=Dreissena polymorpha TaxID=45954 RepID=A0A9D4DYW2_DREPO|nr:uncharacterized protein LOC127844917 [Dreissena polymorpha]KAH3768884.1 hypothetical protein DPMN_170101 [Dreissena polymorpha]
MKFKTVLEGEQAVIYNYLGEGKLVIGPQRVFLFRETLKKLVRYTASQYEYLSIRDIDGIVTHKPGPCDIFLNPIKHESITVMNAIKLDANHMIVVYKRLKDSSVQRRIIQGPCVFVPEAEEWLHDFKWHGSDPDNKARMIPGQDKFQQLAAIPEQFYYNVKEVRTNDDTMITVKLMLFYQLKDIHKMLDTTHDPIADLINAMCADVISFVGKLSFVQFLSESEKLSHLTSYPQLDQWASRIGFQLQKIVFRGYHSSDQLQAMQNSAIESRTQLRLNTEIEGQKQLLADLRFSKEQERAKLRQEMELNKQAHVQRVEDMKQTHQLRLQTLQHEQSLAVREFMTVTRLEVKIAEDKHAIEHLTGLKDLNVDLTSYLASLQPARVSQELQVVKPSPHLVQTSC